MSLTLIDWLIVLLQAQWIQKISSLRLR